MSKDLSDIFRQLGQTCSVEAALSQGVRLACLEGGGLAGAIIVDWGAGRRPSYWFRHDPHELLEPSAFDPRTAGTGPALASANGGTSVETRVFTAPLHCGKREVGWLVLLAAPDMDEETVRCRLAATTPALATLLLAVERDVIGAQASILGRDAFRASLPAQIARSERRGEVFSVLHVRAAGLDGCAHDNNRSPWSDVAGLGELLLARLRRTDLIGLMAPDRLAVLLAGTGRLGARIAARRIELLLSAPESGALHGSGPDSSRLLWCARTFPEDAKLPSELCDVVWDTEQAASPTLIARVT